MTHIPDDWQNVTLGSFCEFKYGKSLPAGQRDGGEFRVYGSNGPVGTHSQAITRGPAVVVGRKGSFGEIHYSSESCWPIDTTYFVDESATSADLKWLSHLLSTLGLTEMNRAAAIPGLNREDAYAKSVLLPSLPEQKRIAAILDAADALRAKRREAIAVRDDLVQSVFVEMFGDVAGNPMGWETRRFGEILSDGPQNGLYKPAGDYGDGVPILRIDSFQAGELKPWSQWKRVNASLLEQERYSLRESDIVVNRVNSRSHLGKSVMVGDVPEGSVFESNMMRIRVDASIVRPVFIERYLQSGFVRKRILESAKDAVNQSSINQQDVKMLPVFVPPMRNQRDFEKLLEQIRGGQQEHRAHLAALDELFTSLQHRAFSGALWDHEVTGEAA